MAPCFGQETHKASYSTLYLSVTRMDISLSGIQANSRFWLKGKEAAGAHICGEVQGGVFISTVAQRRNQSWLHDF